MGFETGIFHGASSKDLVILAYTVFHRAAGCDGQTHRRMPRR